MGIGSLSHVGNLHLVDGQGRAGSSSFPSACFFVNTIGWQGQLLLTQKSVGVVALRLRAQAHWSGCVGTLQTSRRLILLRRRKALNATKQSARSCGWRLPVRKKNRSAASERCF